MSERSQMIHMLVRITRLASERWQMPLSEVATFLGSTDALGYVAHNFGLFHMEGDNAVLDEVEEFLALKGLMPDGAS